MVVIFHCLQYTIRCPIIHEISGSFSRIGYGCPPRQLPCFLVCLTISGDVVARNSSYVICELKILNKIWVARS